MNKVWHILVLVVFASGCQPSGQPTPGLSTSSMTAANPAPTSVSSLTSTTTVQPAAITASMPTPTALPTSNLVEGWLVYHNDLLGYEFSYPPQARIGSAGPDSYSPDDVPPDINFDYFALLESLYSDWPCVRLSLETGFLTIQVPPNRGGKFVTCGVTGVGDYDIVQKSETVIVNRQPYIAEGYQVYERNPSAAFRSEFFFIQLDDGTRLNYGGYWTDAGMTYDRYVPEKEILLQVLSSYRQVVPPPSCGKNWTQLYPGAFALVAGGSDARSNRVRSAPDTSANIITSIDPGETILILEGPACIKDLVFWKVRSDMIPGGAGWTAEGDGSEYYLVPYHP